MARKNKKSSLLDIFPILIVTLFMVVMIVIGYMVWNKINDSNLFSDNAEANAAFQNSGHTIAMYDSLGIFIITLMSIVVILLASQIYSNPAYFFIGLIILIIAFIVAVGFSNTYSVFESSSGISTYADMFPKLSWFMSYLPIYILVMMFGIIIAMYIGANV